VTGGGEFVSVAEGLALIGRDRSNQRSGHECQQHEHCEDDQVNRALQDGRRPVARVSVLLNSVRVSSTISFGASPG